MAENSCQENGVKPLVFVFIEEHNQIWMYRPDDVSGSPIDIYNGIKHSPTMGDFIEIIIIDEDERGDEKENFFAGKIVPSNMLDKVSFYDKLKYPRWIKFLKDIEVIK